MEAFLFAVTYRKSKTIKLCLIPDTREANCYLEYEDGECGIAAYHDLTFGGCCCQCRNSGWGLEEGNCTACPQIESPEFLALCSHGCGFTPHGLGTFIRNLISIIT